MKRDRILLFFVVCLLLTGSLTARQTIPAQQPLTGFTRKALLFSADFNQALDTALWKTEIAPLPHSTVAVKDGQLILDTRGGVTVWLNKVLSGPLLIEYKRTILVDSGANDRLSDLNQFWMASDPRNGNLFTRSGTFEAYDSLLLYYAGIGGNSNTTTRFRRYQGDGTKPLLQEHLAANYLLQPNETYLVQTIVYKGITQLLVNGYPYFTYEDPQPFQRGYFGFRSTWSRQAIDAVRIYRIE